METKEGGITDVPTESENSTKYEELARFAVQDYNHKQVNLVHLRFRFDGLFSCLISVFYFV